MALTERSGDERVRLLQPSIIIVINIIITTITIIIIIIQFCVSFVDRSNRHWKKYGYSGSEKEIDIFERVPALIIIHLPLSLSVRT